MTPKLGKVQDWPVNGDGGQYTVKARSIRIPVGPRIVHFHLALATGHLTHTNTGLRFGVIDPDHGRSMPDELCVALVEETIEKHGVEHILKVMAEAEHSIDVL